MTRHLGLTPTLIAVLATLGALSVALAGVLYPLASRVGHGRTGRGDARVVVAAATLTAGAAVVFLYSTAIVVIGARMSLDPSEVEDLLLVIAGVGLALLAVPLVLVCTIDVLALRRARS